MRASARWYWVLPVVLVGAAGCGFTTAPAQSPGKPASVNLEITTVPTIRSVTVSPAKASFGDCKGGSPGNDTRSAGNALGFPNGKCWVGTPAGSFPIKITNAGIASFIDVSGSSASPADGGDEWALCNLGSNPSVACSGHHNRAPGADQFVLENFSAAGRQNHSGLTTDPVCDHEFNADGNCWALEGTAQREGFELIGPTYSSDTSTKWAVTITWMPVPSD